jgi:hypothetical protein
MVGSNSNGTGTLGSYQGLVIVIVIVIEETPQLYSFSLLPLLPTITWLPYYHYNYFVLDRSPAIILVISSHFSISIWASKPPK